MERIFLQCEVCKNLVSVLQESAKPMQCCGKTMARLVANTADASIEKHVPSVEIDGNKVKVYIGEAQHPSTPEHYIQWIMLAQGEKMQQVALSPTDTPVAEFILDSGGTSPFSVYAICNLHGLWKKNINR